MTEWIRFQAPKRKGVLLHTLVLLSLLAAIGAMLTVASQRPPGLLVVVLLISSVLFGLLLPVFAYRLYALLKSDYLLSREGVRLHWGLRHVAIPHDQVVDVALAKELYRLPPFPRLSWPGSLLGTVQDAELGAVEYLASSKEEQIFLGTRQRVYVISPEKPGEFLAVYHREAERGSITALKPASVSPSFALGQAWADAPIRRLLIGGAALSIAALLLVGFLSPRLEGISLGISPTGAPLAEVPGGQLFLLPALNLAFFLGSVLLGLILFREFDSPFYAKLVWGGSLLSGALFLAAILFIALA